MSGRPTKVVMASGNAGKIREIARLLEGLGVENSELVGLIEPLRRKVYSRPAKTTRGSESN